MNEAYLLYSEIFELQFFHSVETLLLRAPESYHYLSQSGCVSDPTINDVKDFDAVSTNNCILNTTKRRPLC